LPGFIALFAHPARNTQKQNENAESGQPNSSRHVMPRTIFSISGTTVLIQRERIIADRHLKFMSLENQKLFDFIRARHPTRIDYYFCNFIIEQKIKNVN
jgi:hypothetical protein